MDIEAAAAAKKGKRKPFATANYKGFSSRYLINYLNMFIIPYRRQKCKHYLYFRKQGKSLENRRFFRPQSGLVWGINILTISNI